MRINKYFLLLVLLPSIAYGATGSSEDFVKGLESIIGTSLSGATTATQSVQTPVVVTPPITPSPQPRVLPPVKTPIITVPVTVLPSQTLTSPAVSIVPTQNNTSLALNSAPKSWDILCNLPTVDRIFARVVNGGSDLRWLPISGAAGYNLYKKTTDNNWVFVATLNEPSYRIHLEPGSIKYEDFALRVLCAPGKESGNISWATSVQTGPTLYFIIICSSLLGFYIVRKYTISQK